MKTKRTNYLLVLLILGSLAWTCQKEDDDSDDICPVVVPFCDHIQEQDYDATVPLINDYLSNQKMGSPEENLNELVEWLGSKSCVTNVKLICNSCIETAPPRSEIEVVFDSNKIAVSKTLIVLMDNKLRVVEFR